MTPPVTGLGLGFTQVKVTLSREAWAVGKCVTLSCVLSNGAQVSAEFYGGVTSKNGVIQPNSSFSVSKAATDTFTSVTAVVAQTIQTALTLEGF